MYFNWLKEPPSKAYFFILKHRNVEQNHDNEDEIANKGVEAVNTSLDTGLLLDITLKRRQDALCYNCVVLRVSLLLHMCNFDIVQNTTV